MRTIYQDFWTTIQTQDDSPVFLMTLAIKQAVQREKDLAGDMGRGWCLVTVYSDRIKTTLKCGDETLSSDEEVFRM